jgi:hypothetical protein
METAQLPHRNRSKEHRTTIIAAACVAAAVCLCVAALAGPSYWRYASYAPQEGDVIFQSLPRGPLVNAIEGATKSPWSHCGIVARDASGNWIVYEAFQGVETTPLREFIFRSRNGQFAIYRWKEQYQSQVPAILAAARDCLGRPYDARYRLDDEAIYCSELIYKAFLSATGEEAGRLVRLVELDWQDYRPLIEQLEGGPVPLDRLMIAPRDLAEAHQLELVLHFDAKP